MASTVLLLITEEIPNPLEVEYKNYESRIFWHIDPIKRRCVSFRLNAIFELVNYEFLPEIMDRGEQYLNSAIELIDRLGEDVATDLVEGNCNVVSLIHSPGGHGGTADKVGNVIESITKNTKKAVGYVFGHACSSAFIISASFTKLFALLDSEFMFHAGSSFEEMEECFDEEDETPEEKEGRKKISIDQTIYQMKIHLGKFFSRNNEEFKSECDDLSNLCIDNLDADVYFSGEHICRLGVVTDCALSLDELVDWFVKDLGIVPSTDSPLDQLIKKLVNETNQLLTNGYFSGKGLLTEDSPYVMKHPTNNNDSNID